MINETLEEIKTRLRVELNDTEPFKSTNMSPSAVALFDTFLQVIATEVFTLQQLNNTFETEIEGIISQVTTPTDLWWQTRILEFQFSTTTPQVIKLDLITFTPAYDIINAGFQIISNCNVITLSNNTVQIKVTNSGVVLTADQIIALTAYIQTIRPSGIDFVIINELPDYLFVNAEVFYNGQFAATIQTDVEAAITAFMVNLEFNGVVKRSAVMDAIQAVAGVTDVVINETAAMRRTTYDSGGGFPNRNIFIKDYQSFAGQIIEGPAPEAFADTITYTVGNT